MILHGVTDDIGDLDETAIVLLMQRPENAALNRLQAVRQVGDGAIPDDVGGVIEEAAVDARVQRQFYVARHKRLVGHQRDNLFRLNVMRAVAIAVLTLDGRFFLDVFGLPGLPNNLAARRNGNLDRKVRLICVGFAFSCHTNSLRVRACGLLKPAD